MSVVDPEVNETVWHREDLHETNPLGPGPGLTFRNGVLCTVAHLGMEFWVENCFHTHRDQEFLLLPDPA